MGRFAWLIVFCFVVAIHGGTADAANTVVWTMVDVNESDKQGDGHILHLPDGRTFAIDTGFTGKGMLRFVHEHQIRTLDKVFISHVHKDHYGGLIPLIEDGVQIREVEVNLPLKAVCDSEIPWGCDWPDVQRVLKYLADHNIPVHRVHMNESFYDSDGVKLDVLYAYDGLSGPVGKTDVNDTSMIILLQNGKTRVLLTGDLNGKLGTWLAREGGRLEADVLKAPHHGTEGCAPNEFFDRVHPKAVLVPGPKTLWLSERSSRIRKYWEAAKADTFVTGLHGDVTVTLDKDRFEISSDRHYTK